MLKTKFLILIPSFTLAFAGVAKGYTLAEAVSHTLATSPDLLIETNVREEVDKQLRESYAGYLPTLDLNAGWGDQYTNNATTRGALPSDPSGTSGTQTLIRSEFGLLASQMIFDGFAVYHDVQGHKSRVRAESWRVNSTAQDVSQSTIEAYIDVLLGRELVRIGRLNLAKNNEIGEQIKKRSESGIGRKADLDQSIARVALAQTNLMAFEGQLRDAETNFLRQVGIPVPAYLEHPAIPAPFPTSEDEAVESGLRGHPTLHATVADYQVTREEHKGAKAAFVPRLDLQLGLTHNHNIDGSPGPSDDSTAMLRVRWNLFNGGKDLARLCETAYKMQEAQEVSNRAYRQVVQAVRFAWNLYETNKQEMRWLKEHVVASQNTFEAYQKQFNIGQRTLLDLLDSQNELFGAQSALARGRYDEIRGMYRLLNSTGSLTKYLNIQLPYQADPSPTGVMDGSMRFFDKSSAKTFEK
ncbi:MAG: TolC family outer membrane protein [Candidatus Berkiellales bacterium]